MAITVLLADDHALVRQGIRALLADTDDIEVVGEAGSGSAVIELARQLKPDVILLDIHMPRLDGIEALKRLRQEVPDTEVLILSMNSNIELVHQALQNGARGYILKASVYDELEAAIRTVGRSRLYHSEVVDSYLEQFFSTEGDIPSNPLDQLTEREREVLDLLAHGDRSKDIAKRLSLSKRTVDKYRANVMRKLNTSTPIELGRLYARYGRKSEQPIRRS